MTTENINAVLCIAGVCLCKHSYEKNSRKHYERFASSVSGHLQHRQLVFFCLFLLLLFCACGGLTSAGCHTHTQSWSPSLIALGGENKMKKLLGWDKSRETGRSFTSYHRGQCGLDSEKIDFISWKLKIG